MLTIRTLALFVSTATVIANCPVPSRAQSSSAASQASPLTIHLSIKKSTYTVGEKPVAILAMENKGSKAIWFSTSPYLERIHITRNDGEPPRQSFIATFLGTIVPGMDHFLIRALLLGGPSRPARWIRKNMIYPFL